MAPALRTGISHMPNSISWRQCGRIPWLYLKIVLSVAGTEIAKPPIDIGLLETFAFSMKVTGTGLPADRPLRRAA